MATPAPPSSKTGGRASPAAPPAKRGMSIGLQSKLTATQLANHTRACVAVHALVIVVLPSVTHVEAFRKDTRLASTAVVFWITAGLLGLLGMTALQRRNNLLLCVYVVACIMTGAALAVYSLLMDYLLASSCLVRSTRPRERTTHASE